MRVLYPVLWLWHYVGNFWFCLEQVFQWENIGYKLLLNVLKYYYEATLTWFKVLIKAVKTRDIKTILVAIGQIILIYNMYDSFYFYIPSFLLNMSVIPSVLILGCFVVPLIFGVPIVLSLIPLGALYSIIPQDFFINFETLYEKKEVFCKLYASILGKPLINLKLPAVFYLAPLWEWLLLYTFITLWPKPKSSYWSSLWKALTWLVTLRQIIMVLAIHVPAYWIYHVNGNPFINELPQGWSTISMVIDTVLIAVCAYAISQRPIQRISTVYAGVMLYECLIFLLDTYHGSSTFQIFLPTNDSSTLLGTQHYIDDLLNGPNHLSRMILPFLGMGIAYWFSSRRRYLSLPERDHASR
ncbi:MAG: hypothetical protein ACKO37_01445 [Vampirovibrionales bacterium]